MMASKVLLVEDDPARAQRVGSALARCGIESFHTTGADETEEALGIRQFDVILLSSLAKPPEVLRRLQTATRRLCPSAKFIVWGACEAGLCDGILPEHISEADLASELSAAQNRAVANGDDAGSRLPVFDLPGFRQQMGDDPDLMREIVGIFFEESAGQMRELNETLARGEIVRASRLAHSLKGSLGSLHAARARHWAQTLETAAAAGDANRSHAALMALSEAIDELIPDLREVLS
jgi:HPt (histidine-containing phosphotransfer) domain-containing protein/CheY-like chemotaxis protein